MNTKRLVDIPLILSGLALLSACSPTMTPDSSMGVDNPTPTTDAVETSDIVVAPTDSPTVQGAVTWWKDIKPIVDQSCAGCHVEGGIGPMPLANYAAVAPMARLLASQTTSRAMPPWMAADGCRDLKDSRALTPEEIALFSQWASTGAQEGNMADYHALPPRANTTMPLPNRPGDLVVQPAAEYLPNQRMTDDYHCFVIDPQITETRDVVGMRITPTNARIVHHMLLFEVRAGGLAQMQRLDDAEPGPGYTCFGGPGVDINYRAGTNGDLADFDVQQVAAWVPGSVSGYMPEGTGIRVKPGSRFVMQVHYNVQVSTRNMTDRIRADLYYGAPGATNQALWLPQSNASFNVPAGVGPTDPRARAEAEFRNTLPIPLRIFGVFPHMHQRGQSIQVNVRTAAGRDNCMVNIPDWNFHWQQNYFFRVPFRPAGGANGDTLRTTCIWDNRPEAQPFVEGVQVSPHPLHWGEGSDDEMCLNYYYVSL